MALAEYPWMRIFFVGLNLVPGKLGPRLVEHRDQLQVDSLKVSAFGDKCVTVQRMSIDVPVFTRTDESRYQQHDSQLVSDPSPFEAGPPGISAMNSHLV
jgi:hypothetical protein